MDTAFQIFEIMQKRSIAANLITYNSLMDACVRCDMLEKAWDVMSQMKAQGIKPDNFTYSILIKGIKYQDDPTSIAIIDSFTNSEEPITSERPDEILYNCLMDACIRLKDINRAVALFNEMQMADIKPSSVTYGILIKAYGQANQLQNAFNAFLKMKENG